jgi:hypothetical protein
MALALEPHMKAFPAPEEVFAGDVAAHRKVLQPLLSIDASAVDPSWSGKLHFVTPIEPYDGLLGEDADDYYKDSVQLNWIAFRVSESKYEFLGDFRYFAINRDPDQFLTDVYIDKEASYAESKRYFAETGELRAPLNREMAVEWFDQIGGDAYDGNWAAFGLEVDAEDGMAHPLTPDGRRFRLVGALTGFHYRKECADGILLFFDAKTSTAVLTFDWT